MTISKSDSPQYALDRLDPSRITFARELRGKTKKELAELKRSTIQLIDQIENDSKYKAIAGGLCDWCEFQEICKEWSHLYKIKDKPNFTCFF